MRLAVGTEAEIAHDRAGVEQALAVDPARFYVACVDLNVPDAPDALVDTLLAHDIPVIVQTDATELPVRDALLDKPIIEYIVRAGTGEIEYVTNVIHRVYNNRFIEVLIADGSAQYREYLRDLLRIQQYRTFEAADAEQVLQVLEAHSGIRLAIIDHGLPGMDPLALLGRIRERVRRSELAILALAEAGDARLAAKLLKFGANDFITRPLSVEEFHCRVTQGVETIEHIRLVEESATRDYLTHAYNRRYLFEAGERLHENAKRGNLTLASAMIDADHFKRINDTHGHHVGDVVLKEITATLTRCLRQSDLIARFGGEEFCVLAAGLDRAGASNVFERVRQEIAALRIPLDDAELGVTVSIGVSLRHAESLEGLIKQADEALYQAKSGGRDRVVIFS